MDDVFAPDDAVNGTIVTREGGKQAVLWLHSTFGHTVLTVEDVDAEGDRVAVRWSIRGVHRGTFLNVAATGKEVTLSGMTIYRYVDGRFKESHETVDIPGLLQQIGSGSTA